MQVHYGLGEKGKVLTDYQNEQILIVSTSLAQFSKDHGSQPVQMKYTSISTYCASIGLTKLAILMQYKHVFSTLKFQIWS